MKRSLLAIRHLEPEQIQNLLELGKDFKAKILSGEVLSPPSVRTVGLLFFESSTRTRVSFEQACSYLGYRFTNFSSSGSSMSKGETLKDTILTLRSERLDAVVMRHRASGSPVLAAQLFQGPVLNAGDGEHEHPTQALGDALTILESKGHLAGLKVAIVGDVLHSRVARSNAWLLSKMGAEVRLVGPRTLIPLHAGLFPGKTYYELAPALEDADVVMCLRLQKERMESGLLSSIKEYRRLYQINKETLKLARKDCIVMHPGPLNRGIELDDYAADGPKSVILKQVENGIFARMAGLHWVFESDPEPAKKKIAAPAKPAKKAPAKKAVKA